MANQLPNRSTTSDNRNNVFVRETGIDVAGDDALLRAASTEIEQWAREQTDVRFSLRRFDDHHFMLGFLSEKWLLACAVYILEEGVCAKLSAHATDFDQRPLPADERARVTLWVASINSSLARGYWSVAGENDALVFAVPVLRRFTSQSSVEPLCAASLNLAFLSIVASVHEVDRFLPHVRSGALNRAVS